MTDEKTSDDSPVSVSVEGTVATVTLREPKRLNALNQAMLTGLDTAVDEVGARDDVRVVLIEGEGRAFAAGADIKAMSQMSVTEAEKFSQFAQSVFTKIENLAPVTIALVQGYALGGGNEFAMSADIRIAAEKTKFGQPEVGLGILPSFGGTQRLARIVGEGRALWLTLSAQSIDAAEAERIGLVTKVVPVDQLHQTGVELAIKLAALAPYALRVAKKAVYVGERLNIRDGLAFEAAEFGLCFGTEDQREGMRAFLEKRQASFVGR